MKLISFNRREDFGTELHVQVLYTKRWALLQASVSWNDYASFPFLQVRFGMGSLVNIMFCIYKLGFDICICERTWNFVNEIFDIVKQEDETTT